MQFTKRPDGQLKATLRVEFHVTAADLEEALLDATGVEDLRGSTMGASLIAHGPLAVAESIDLHSRLSRATKRQVLGALREALTDHGYAWPDRYVHPVVEAAVSMRVHALFPQAYEEER